MKILRHSAVVQKRLTVTWHTHSLSSKNGRLVNTWNMSNPSSMKVTLAQYNLLTMELINYNFIYIMHITYVTHCLSLPIIHFRYTRDRQNTNYRPNCPVTLPMKNYKRLLRIYKRNLMPWFAFSLHTEYCTII